MKKIIVGSILTMIGASSNIALIISFSFHINKLNGWENNRNLLAAIQHTGASILILPMIFSTICLIIGIYNLYNGKI